MQRPSIRRRLLPPVPLVIKHEDGSPEISLELAITNAALGRMEERTGIDTLNDILALWRAMGRRRVLNAAFWAACLAYQPQFDSSEGYEILVSHLDPTNEIAVTDALWEAYCRWAGEARAEQLKKILERTKEILAGEAQPDPTQPTTQTKGESSEEKQAGSSSTPSPAMTPEFATKANSAS